MHITRRHLMGLSALTAAAGSLGAAGAVAAWWTRAPAQGCTFLTPEESAFVRAFAGAVFPPTPALPLGGSAAAMDHFVDDAMGALPSLVQGLTRVLVNVLDGCTLPTHGSMFRALRPEDRFPVLDGLLRSEHWELRSATTSFVILVGMGYTTHPENAPFFARMYGCGYGR